MRTKLTEVLGEKQSTEVVIRSNSVVWM